MKAAVEVKMTGIDIEGVTELIDVLRKIEPFVCKKIE